MTVAGQVTDERAETIKRIAAQGYTPGGVSDDVARHSIAVERMLCAALGRDWQPSGMSTETLCLDILTELQHRREAEAGSNLQKVQSTPDGWVLVPREPTPEMCEDGQRAFRNSSFHDLRPIDIDALVGSGAFRESYRAMLAASPSSPASGVRVKLHRFRPNGADTWSEWRFGPANLTPASGCEWEDVDFVPALSALGEHP